MLPISSYQGELWARAQGCDAAVVMVKHDVYQALDLGALKDALRTPIVVDGRNVLRPDEYAAAGLVVRALGKGLE